MTTVTTLRLQALDTLAEALGGARKVGLVNFPNHGNPGDPAIWLGTQSLLADLDVKVPYRAAWWNFDARLARRALGDAPILLNGGGTLGDLYEGQQGTRVRVLREMTGNPVIQMPQSIHFQDPANAAAFGDLTRQHGAFTLMVREHLAADIARDQLGIDPLLSPDHALGMRAPRSAKAESHPEPSHDFLWMMWGPGWPEHVDYAAPEDPRVLKLDWVDRQAEDQAEWPLAGRATLALNQRLKASWSPDSRCAGTKARLAAKTYDPLARLWVDRCFGYLRRARVVVTNKLHGHVFCALACIPHVVLNNSYGKVSGTRDSWTSALPGVHRASTGEQAWQIAQELLEGAL